MFNQGQVGSAIVTFPVEDKFKAIVVHGLSEGHYTYAGTAAAAANKLKKTILTTAAFEGIEIRISHAKFSA